MRLDRLDLVKYGRFTDHVLDFSAPGVHLVVGPNEAGKSTMRNAVTDLLYGIPARTTYGYLHGMQDLRIGALLRAGDGSELEIVRLKKIKDPLRTVGDEVLDPRELQSILAGVTKDDFTDVFAIDHEELRTGGAALLAGKGDLAKALFESRSSAQLTTLLARLREEHSQLYVPRGRIPVLNAAIGPDGSLSQARRELDEQILRPETYRESERAVDDATKQYEGISEDLKRARTEQSRLTRIRQAYAGMEQRRQLLEERAQLLAAGPLVAGDVGYRYDTLRSERKEAETILQGFVDDVREVEDELREQSPDLAVLAVAETIAVLHADANGVEKAEKAGLKAARSADELRGQASSRLAKLRAGVSGDSEVETVAPTLRARVGELMNEQTVLATELGAARKQVKSRGRALDAELAKLPADAKLVDRAPLAAVVKAVPSSLSGQILALEKQYTAAQAKLAKARKRNARFALPEDVGDLTVPSVEEIAAYRKRIDDTDKAVARCGERVALRTTELTGHRRDLENFLRQDPPPSETDLAASRAHRQELWGQLHSGLVDPPSASTAPLPVSEYETAVAASDETVDRMRRDAQRMAERSQLEEAVEKTEHLLSEVQKEHEVAVEDRQALETGWNELWTPSDLPAPAVEAATDLLAALQILREQIDERDALLLTLDSDRAAANAHATRLREALADAGFAVPPESASLDELIEAASAFHATLAETAKKRSRITAAAENLRNELTDAQSEVTRLETELADWDEKWKRLLADNQLTGTPAQVAASLSELDEIARLHADALRFQEQADEADIQVSAFTSRLDQALADAGQPPLTTPDRRYAVVRSLKDYLDRQSASQDQITRLTDRLATLRGKLESARNNRAEADQNVAAVLAEDSMHHEHELVEAIERTDAIRDLDKQLKAVENSLAGAGVGIAQLEQEVSDHDPDELTALIADLDARILQLEGDLGTRAAELARCKNTLEQMNGSDAAAIAADAVEEQRSGIVHHAHDYLRLRLAEQILLKSIETYRQENQAPVLRRAQHIFARITHDEYPELVDDTDVDGKAVLRARRGSGPLVDVEDMSEGTRDQLYLALRLASLDRYADEGRAMPLLLDDVLMTFDDGRTGAGLSLLDEMADRFQVIVFTHHEHIGRIAQDALAAGRIHVHDLIPASEC
ncbi:conserved hypothetical protein [Catenulispora acidiphila DSM 44928]|uniref:YhaN AAA domain-containing protein n=1 Tax=Catenulispora acidiphila (strain DSM 44928 / JCM 14897 / NBRC 102108 / NRRL B-24433 / ID139908) TaxID=479433 RepID=C7QAP3_CATAD|nr:YhaN family protein [Catenulispora acidiphila]ACU74366.1 conserved hypothetical protein [Catenulispora acidiphila DSM 44928]